MVVSVTMKDFNKRTQDLNMKNSCGARKRGCKVIGLPTCLIIAMPKEIVCDEIESYERLKKVA